MLLDNKTKTADKEYSTVYDFLRNYIEQGKVDIVTGYFSVSALARIKDEINYPEGFRMVLGNLLKEDNQQDRAINLLSDSLGIPQVLNLSQSATKAVDFLRQEKVQVKTIQRSFCHAKTYIYYDPDTRKNFHIIGSSNLTDAGLGIRESGNIELNSASTGNNNDFKELTKWFSALWLSKDALETIELPGKSKVSVKDHIINLIQNLYRKYTPFELYYKVLYELFKEDLLSLSLDPEFKKEISHLEDTVIYKLLYSFQQKGVISLIKMLQKNNGAILADAVGLGKTWTALAVMKYFEMKGYRVLLFCPKKLDANWRQYLEGHRSKFERDRLKYTVRYHTDLQDDRLESYQDGYKINTFFQGNPKMLIVIDESHNMRNDKSSRYKFLVDNILRKNKDVKVLQLSATPVNNKLIDVRNQFKLIVKGHDSGFKETALEIGSLESIFRTAQKDFKLWQQTENRKISDFIQTLPQKFFSLTDALIVARTRKLIESEFGSMSFPKKEDTENEYINPENIGNLKSFEELLKSIESINLIAYMPHKYTEEIKPESVLEDKVKREGFLVKMMYILLMKRLESSWFSFKNTVNNIYNHHTNALQKVNNFINAKEDTVLEDEISKQNDFEDDLEETSAEFAGTDDETEQASEFTLGKKNPIKLSDMRNIDSFKSHLENDIKNLEKLKANLEIFKSDLEEKKAKDIKLERVIDHIEKKRRERENQKVVVFTVFKDTAKYLYDQLKKRGYTGIAYVSGSVSETDDGYSGKKFEEILERFAPYTKLYKEKDWSYLYEEKGILEPESYEDWVEIIKKHDPVTFINKLEKPLDILIATDCLSEGQNLQDCDCVINYDIHWNPVRIIQRMGRIDRIGSPNKSIKGINFWPGKNYEDYLQLKARVENRMAAMSLVGTEIDDKMTPEIEEMVKNNPMISRQTEKMLNQLRFTWEDVETSDENLGLNDLSLEQFRQELFDIFQKNKDFFERMPNGIFTGFKAEPDKKYTELPKGIIALLGYPRKPDDSDTHKYNEFHLLYSHTKGFSTYNNNQEILGILRKHKNKIRVVPDDVENGDNEALQWLSDKIKKWIEGQVPLKAIDEIQGIFADGVPKKRSPEEKKLEDKFKQDNFDLITWFVISE